MIVSSTNALDHQVFKHANGCLAALCESMPAGTGHEFRDFKKRAPARQRVWIIWLVLILVGFDRPLTA
jgi:hypothetical protein